MEAVLNDYYCDKKTKVIHISLFLQLVKCICEHSCIILYPEWLDKIVSAIILFACVYICVKKAYRLKMLIIYMVVGVIAIYGGAVTGKMVIATTTLTIFSLRNENMKEIAAFLYKWKLRLFCIHTMLAFILVPLGVGYLSGVYDHTGRYRWSLGFGMPGQFADYIFDIVILWIFCNFHGIERKHYLRLIAISVVVMVFSDSRLIFVDSMLLIGLIWLVKKTSKFNHIIKRFAQGVVPILTCGVFYLIYQYSLGNIYAVFLDILFSTRIRLNGYLFELYGGSFFGQYITQYSGQFSEVWQTTGSTFDCLYPWLVVEMGAVWLIILIVAWFKLAARNNAMINCFIIVWSLAAAIDTDFIRGSSSFVILLIVLLLSKERYNHESLQFKN